LVALTVSLVGRSREIETESIVFSNLLNLRINAEQSEEFAGLVLSIRKHGLIHPIIVREIASAGPKPSYEIVCGYRRFAACRKLGLRSILCSVQELNDRSAFEVALSENIQRQSLNPIEEAEAFKSYIVNFGRGSVSELARRIGKSEEYVSHRMLLLGLPKPIVEKVRRRLLKPGEATELVWLANAPRQVQLAEEITKRRLSFRQTRSAVKLLKKSKMAVSDGVDLVVAGTRTQDDFSPNFDENSVNQIEDNRTDSISVLDHAALILRTCLAGLDLLTEKKQREEVRDILMKERRSVHGVLDDVIRQKVKLSRNPNS
jgi:ParB family chromosome partitioning protein